MPWIRHNGWYWPRSRSTSPAPPAPTLASVFHAKATTATIRRQLIAVLGRPHPKTHGAGPQSLTELRPIRADLERAQEDLQSLRFKLASALFSGMPPGAKQVLEP